MQRPSRTWWYIFKQWFRRNIFKPKYQRPRLSSSIIATKEPVRKTENVTPIDQIEGKQILSHLKIFFLKKYLTLFHLLSSSLWSYKLKWFLKVTGAYCNHKKVQIKKWRIKKIILILKNLTNFYQAKIFYNWSELQTLLATLLKLKKHHMFFVLCKTRTKSCE